jgi:hypothetical protein
MLGRIQQSVDDLRALFLRSENNQDVLLSRIESLEGSRTWAKAWIAGGIAWSTAVFCFALYVYRFAMEYVRH